MEIKYLNIDYIDEIDMLVYNGKECNFENNIFPHTTQTNDKRYNAHTNIIVDIENGKIIDWPIGNCGIIMSKPVDSGIYTFMNENKENVLRISDYVIDGLDIDDEGFGDYIYLTILKDGTIKNWNSEKILNVYLKQKEM